MTGDGEPTRQAWIRSALSEFEGPLIRYALRITGDIETARDAVQDTFFRLCAQDRRRIDGHLAEWLFTVCRNRATDIRKKERRMKTLPEAWHESHSSPDPPPAAAIEDREETDRILQLLGALPDNQQEVIRLKFQGGLSYRDISKVTQLSVSNVGFLIHTGLKTIRGRLS